jgi:hypothetical protein
MTTSSAGGFGSPADWSGAIEEHVMAKSRQRRDGKWDERLMCRVQQVAYDFRTQTARLDFPELNCCDMSGAIEMVTAIAPDVRVIETYAGGKPDTVFRRNGDDWDTFMR